MKIKLPQVHPLINVAGALTTLAISVGSFAVSNQTAIVGMFPAKDAMVAALAISVIATLLPDKRQVQPAAQQAQAQAIQQGSSAGVDSK